MVNDLYQRDKEIALGMSIRTSVARYTRADPHKRRMVPRLRDYQPYTKSEIQGKAKVRRFNERCCCQVGQCRYVGCIGACDSQDRTARELYSQSAYPNGV